MRAGLIGLLALAGTMVGFKATAQDRLTAGYSTDRYELAAVATDNSVASFVDVDQMVRASGVVTVTIVDFHRDLGFYKSSEEFNCRQRTHRVVVISAYTASGVLRGTDKGDDQLSAIPAPSILDTEYKLICEGKAPLMPPELLFIAQHDAGILLN